MSQALRTHQGRITGEMDSTRIDYEALVEKFDDPFFAHNNLAWVYGENELK